MRGKWKLLKLVDLQGTSKRPCLGACCLATTYIHPVWFSFYFFSFFFYIFSCVERGLEWSWLHNMRTYVHVYIVYCPCLYVSLIYFVPPVFASNHCKFYDAIWQYVNRLIFKKGLLLVPQHTRLMMLNFMCWDCCVSGEQCEYTAVGRSRKAWNATPEWRHKQALLSILSWI